MAGEISRRRHLQPEAGEVDGGVPAAGRDIERGGTGRKTSALRVLDATSLVSARMWDLP